MKKLAITLFLIPFLGFGQALSYSDLGVLLSESNLNGTGRFNAMGGAFGALGGDLSAMEINPAAGAVFKLDEFGFSLSFNELDITSYYYGNQNTVNNSNTDFEQIGFVSVTQLSAAKDEINKVYFGFNYTKTANYDQFWIADGNSGVSTWVDDPTDPDIQYTDAEYQYFNNYTDGGKHQYSMFAGGQYGRNFYIGAGIKVHTLDFYQSTIQEEFNNDGNGNTVDAYIEQWQQLYGTGVSLNFGFIARLNQALRIGLAYESPNWWSIREESNIIAPHNDPVYGYYEAEYSTDPGVIYHNNYNKLQVLDYGLSSPGKLTSSAALVLGKFGLISFDYTWINYQNLQYTDRYFQNENIYYSQNLENTSNFAMGTEWRFGPASIRGGYRLYASPYKDALEDENQEEITMGIGFNFGRFKFDLAYQFSTVYSTYNFYPGYPEVQPADLKEDFSKFTTSFLIRL
ncbi:hemin receptor [Flavobacteriaceae bacterium]|nr:hemin receptor [Flavobacteriaceae bacterium]